MPCMGISGTPCCLVCDVYSKAYLGLCLIYHLQHHLAARLQPVARVWPVYLCARAHARTHERALVCMCVTVLCHFCGVCFQAVYYSQECCAVSQPLSPGVGLGSPSRASLLTKFL